MTRFWLGFAFAAALTPLAAAHSPYLLPNVFISKDRDHVTVEGSFTEGFFTPDVAMKSDDYHVVGPDGAKAALTPTYLKDLTVLEVPTATEGTYRISSGARVGRTAKAYEKDGQWEFLEPGATPPEGAEAVDMQSLTLADTYVSRGKPDAKALAPRGTGLEFVPVTHPNEAAAGDPVQFQLLFDGKPVADQPVQLHRDGETYTGAAPPEAKTDAEGKIAFTPTEADVYLVMTRYRMGPAAEGGPYRSYTATVSFEVVP
ncbi:hypothetical protein sos41_13250 [Alphaproteobacteria bacterium SO-S41]|nr:hypothetical protein sos41_13250 [Alphaproteobacteria bacterium SO-S41]